MTPPNPNPTITAILALLDAASAIIQLPAHVRQQNIGSNTIQFLLEDAKSLDWALSQDLDKSHPTPDPIPPTAQNGPKRREKPARPPETPAPHRTPVLPPIPAATMKIETANEDHPHPSSRLPFAEFDQICRAEMKRLSMDGRLPGHKLWNSERNLQLPTMAAVLLRYNAATLVELATILGLEPPLSAEKERKP